MRAAGSLFAVFHHRDRFECHHVKLLVYHDVDFDGVLIAPHALHPSIFAAARWVILARESLCVFASFNLLYRGVEAADCRTSALASVRLASVIHHDPQRSPQNRPLMVGSKAAINRVCPGRVLFYPVASCEGKSILVRQLRGPHLRTWP